MGRLARMPTTRRLAAIVLAALLALAPVPAGALAQSAGDEQYADPFAGQGSGSGKSGSGGGGSGSTSGSSGSSTSGSSGSSSPSSGVAGSSSQSPGSSSASGSASGTASATAQAQQLPRTGLDLRLVAGAGVVLLIAGLAVRRRSADGRP